MTRIVAILTVAILLAVMLVLDADARGRTATTATAKEAITLEGTRSPVIPVFLEIREND
jgi:hypothetical protein